MSILFRIWFEINKCLIESEKGNVEKILASKAELFTLKSTTSDKEKRTFLNIYEHFNPLMQSSWRDRIPHISVQVLKKV